MKLLRNTLLAAILCLGAAQTQTAPLAAAELPGLAIGKPAPDFALKNQDGETVQLSELTKQGQVALVFYRSADWCPFCQKHLIELQAGLAEIKAAGVQLVGISYDNPEALKRFAAKQNLGFPLLSDSGSKTIKAYGLLNEDASGRAEGVPHPVTLIVDSAGVIRAKLGFDGYRQRHTSKDLIEKARAIADTKTK